MIEINIIKNKIGYNNPTGIKKCIRCNNDKPFNLFRRDFKKKLTNECLDCYGKKIDYINYLKLNNLKVCSICKKEKPLNNFTKCGDTTRVKYKDGLYSYCQDCSTGYFRDVTQKRKAFYKESKAIYRQKNRLIIRENARKAGQIHKFKKLATVHNGRAKRDFNDFNEVTPHQIWCLAKKQKLVCAISGEKLTNENISLDHKIALSRGGTNAIDNLQLVTVMINKMKNHYSHSDFLELVNKIYLFNKKKKADNVTCPPC